MKAKPFRIGLLAVLLGALFFFYFYDLHNYFTLEWLKTSRGELREVPLNHPGWAESAYFLIYVAATALSLPVASILSLLGATVFGFWKGVLLVSFASTLGATVAFLGSRFLFRDLVSARFPEEVRKVQQGFEKDGQSYLLSLRLVPAVPFFMINLAMGLTSMKMTPYFWVSWIGMLPGTIVYINAGTQLSNVNSLQEIVSWQIWLSLLALGLLPFVIKALSRGFALIKNNL